MADSGIGEDGVWRPVWPRQRPPFEPGHPYIFKHGHTLSLKHGGRATVSNMPAATELADALREHVPGYTEGDYPVLELYSLTLVRISKMTAWLASFEEYGREEPENADRVRSELRTATNQARRLAETLGLTPGARAKMAGSLAQAQGAVLQQQLRERYGS